MPKSWEKYNKDRNPCVGMDKLGYIQIKARIVHQNQHIRLPRNNVLLAALHIGKDGAQMQQYGNEPHIRQLFVMLHHHTAHCSHEVASEETELRLRVLLLQCSHQMGGMQVAGSFTDNQVILHIN